MIVWHASVLNQRGVRAQTLRTTTARTDNRRQRDTAHIDVNAGYNVTEAIIGPSSNFQPGSPKNSLISNSDCARELNLQLLISMDA